MPDLQYRLNKCMEVLDRAIEGLSLLCLHTKSENDSDLATGSDSGSDLDCHPFGSRLGFGLGRQSRSRPEFGLGRRLYSTAG